VGSLATIYVQLISARVRSQLQYRVSFVLYVAAAFCLSFIDFLTVLVIFLHLPRLGGWTLGEVAFLYGTSYSTFKLTDMAIGHLDLLPQQIQSGAFDLVMIRPLGALFQALTADFALRHVGSAGQGLLVLGISLTMVEIDWTPGRVLVFALIPVSGCVIFASVWILGATTTFWTVRTMEMVNAFTYGGNQFTSYPLNIYAGWFRRLFAFVIPLAFVNYFPSLYILDKPDPLGAPDWLRFLSPVVAAVLAVIAWQVWNVGVRHYRSTGS
jgi:ABC-2 type transport system permease protein